jgi:hypothetical protein
VLRNPNFFYGSGSGSVPRPYKAQLNKKFGKNLSFIESSLLYKEKVPNFFVKCEWKKMLK